jgi:U6 snRNA-associated Sm-like protein LSm7
VKDFEMIIDPPAENSQLSFFMANNNALELGKFLNQKIRVSFQGGRQVCGVLKGYDQLVNLVLEDCVETNRDPKDSSRLVSTSTRNVGTVMCKGTAVTLITPEDGFGEIANPFVGAAEE